MFAAPGAGSWQSVGLALVPERHATGLAAKMYVLAHVCKCHSE